MAIAIILCVAVVACLILLCVAEGAWTKFWIFAVGVICLTLLPFQSASITRGTVTLSATSLSDCGLREGIVYKTEVDENHTHYRSLVVVRNESDFSHRACMVREYLPERFVVVDGRAVTVDEAEDRAPIGDTQFEQQEAERRRNASYEGNFGQGQGSGEEIVVTGHRQ